ncbi:MAG: choice-of-anchor L domain-containing protein [Flavobacteriales bacterium]|nr:choice-of-anchor L domain-containing protein [Flavobacteriales bacterium]
MKRILSAFAALALMTGAQSQIVLDNTMTVTDIVNNILLGEGVTATNVTFNGMNGDMVTVQVGTFNGENTNVGFDSGMIMASGGITVVQGPNNSSGMTVDSGSGNTGSTDPDFLDINPGYTANDWCVIEFDFTAVGDSVQFRYVWGSEEYMEWVNSSFNDVFAFFLSGPGIDGPYTNDAINIALIPGTSSAVTIDNVNANVNAQYYVNGGDGFSEPEFSDPYFIQFDGFTVPLVASAEVQCGQTYHIKLACADSGDSILDCGVFIEEGSFSSNALNIQGEVVDPPAFLPSGTILEGCVDGFFTIFQPDETTADTLALTFSGSGTSGVDYTPFPSTVIIPEGEISIELPFTSVYDNIDEGTESVTISYTYVNSCGDPDTAIATMYIMDYVEMELSFDDLFICPGSDLNVSAEPDGGAPNFEYAWSTGATTENENFEEGEAGDYSVTVTDYCEQTVTAEIHVAEPEPFVQTQDSLDLCLGQPSGGFVIGGATPYIYDYDSTIFVYASGTGFTAIEEGLFTIDVVDQCGQDATLFLDVHECETLIPNIFTPNGDGENDTFTIFGVEGFPGSDLFVYNRWGNLIYESGSYSNQWDGKDQKDGVYYYIFNRADGLNFEGYVHLVRGE